MAICPDCGDTYDDDNESMWGGCGCGYNPSEDAYYAAEANKAEAARSLRLNKEKRQVVLGISHDSNTQAWLAKKSRKKKESLEKIDRSKFPAAIWLDKFEIEEIWSPDFESWEDGEPGSIKFEKADRIVDLIQASLPKPYNKDRVCQCEKVIISCDDWFCDISEISGKKYKFGFIVKSNMHTNDLTLLQDVFARVFELYALNSGVGSECEAGGILPTQSPFTPTMPEPQI